MKQRSPKQGFEPGQRSAACERVTFIHSSKRPKSCHYGAKSLKREELKKEYRRLRYQDRETGFKKYQLFQDFFALYRQAKSGDKSEETKLKLGEIAQEIKDIVAYNRFRDDFPSFASFRHYVVKNGVTLDELREM